MTSAPKSAMTRVHSAPGIPREKSSTVSPVHGPGMDLPPPCGVFRGLPGWPRHRGHPRPVKPMISTPFYCMRRDARSMTRRGELTAGGDGIDVSKPLEESTFAWFARTSEPRDEQCLLLLRPQPSSGRTSPEPDHA